MIQPSHKLTPTGNSGGSRDTLPSSPLGSYKADATVGTVNDPKDMAEIHIDSPPFTEYEGSMNPANSKLKTIFLTIVLAAIYALLGLLLLGCATFIPERPMPKPWNFPELWEWNQPFETSWQNAVDKYRELTAPKGKVWDPLMNNYQQDLGSLM